MIRKRPRLIIAFHTTHDAMAFEEFCHNNNVSGRLIPLPGEISAGCGLAWSAPPENEEEIDRSLLSAGVDPQVVRVLSVF